MSNEFLSAFGDHPEFAEWKQDVLRLKNKSRPHHSKTAEVQEYQNQLQKEIGDMTKEFLLREVGVNPSAVERSAKFTGFDDKEVYYSNMKTLKLNKAAYNEFLKRQGYDKEFDIEAQDNKLLNESIKRSVAHKHEQVSSRQNLNPPSVPIAYRNYEVEDPKKKYFRYQSANYDFEKEFDITKEDLSRPEIFYKYDIHTAETIADVYEKHYKDKIKDMTNLVKDIGGTEALVEEFEREQAKRGKEKKKKIKKVKKKEKKEKKQKDILNFHKINSMQEKN